MAGEIAVVPYSIERLVEVIAAKAGARPEVIEAKAHRNYFEEYFRKIGAQIIIVEDDYVDRDFLEDFSSYYVRCHTDYSRRCTRLHFFNIPFEQEDFDHLLEGETTGLTAKTLQDAYLGFIVVRPLPKTAIGRTCLKTYPEDDTGRMFPVLQTTTAHLCGIALQVTSLPFQEQDRVVAACATSALWSAFQGTSREFHHPALSPVEITRAATLHSHDGERLMPNSGLNPQQLGDGVRGVGLEPEKIELATGVWPTRLKMTAYAYLRARIPAVLGFELFDADPAPLAPRSRGLHAVAVTGFRLDRDMPLSADELRLRANRITRLFVHDDQIGPFARMVFENADGSNHLSSSWRDRAGYENVRARPKILMLPLYHKIRIRFNAIMEQVAALDEELECQRLNGALWFGERLEWDVYLTTINDLKQDLSGVPELRGVYRRKVLQTRLPRFLWRATATDGKSRVLDILFDATDVEQGEGVTRVIEYEPLTAIFLRKLAQELRGTAGFHSRKDARILNWLASQPTDRNLPPSS